MMHTAVSAPQRLPPRPLLNNFHLLYGSKYIVSVLQLQIKIRFKNLHCYLHIFFFLCESRADCQYPTPDIVVYATNLADRKIICEFKKTF